MKRISRVLLRAFVAALVTAPFASLPAAAAALAGASTAAATAARTAKIPVLAPTGLPDDLVGGGVNWATLAGASSSGYEISISQRKGCTSPGCRFGFMRGSRATTASASGRAVMFGGIHATYAPGTCDATCTESTLTWTASGARYVLGIRGAGLSALESTARTLKRF